MGLILFSTSFTKSIIYIVHDYRKTCKVHSYQAEPAAFFLLIWEEESKRKQVKWNDWIEQYLKKTKSSRSDCSKPDILLNFQSYAVTTVETSSCTAVDSAHIYIMQLYITESGWNDSTIQLDLSFWLYDISVFDCQNVFNKIRLKRTKHHAF